MQWSDFGPYVHPFVTGCPEPVLHHHARLAAIKFCKKTLCWTKRLDPITTVGLPEIEIDPELQAQIIKTKQVFVGGKDWPLISPEDGLPRVDAESSERFAFTENGKSLFIYPVQPPGMQVLVRAAMAPTAQATKLHEDLDEYAEDIAHGAVASIMRLPLLANPDHAIHETMFRDRIKTIAMKVGRGMLAARVGGSASFM